MPTYVFECIHCGTFERFLRMAEFTRFTSCDKCGAYSLLVVTPTVQASIFTPYVEHHMSRDPIHIESKKQRDELCEKYSVTYDSVKQMMPPKPQAAVDTMNDNEIRLAIEQARIPGDKNK